MSDQGPRGDDRLDQVIQLVAESLGILSSHRDVTSSMRSEVLGHSRALRALVGAGDEPPADLSGSAEEVETDEWPDGWERIARCFHRAYEDLAPEHGYETREESAVPWGQVPLQNRRLMIRTVGHVLRDMQDFGWTPLAAPVQGTPEGDAARLSHVDDEADDPLRLFRCAVTLRAAREHLISEENRVGRTQTQLSLLREFLMDADLALAEFYDDWPLNILHEERRAWWATVNPHAAPARPPAAGTTPPADLAVMDPLEEWRQGQAEIRSLRAERDAAVGRATRLEEGLEGLRAWAQSRTGTAYDSGVRAANCGWVQRLDALLPSAAPTPTEGDTVSSDETGCPECGQPHDPNDHDWDGVERGRCESERDGKHCDRLAHEDSFHIDGGWTWHDIDQEATGDWDPAAGPTGWMFE